MIMYRVLAIIALSSFLLLTFPKKSYAVWFEASGQAVIQNNNKKIARQRATQEAIKQALLFAGASVSSVQQMANGLLQNDQFEIRAAGEVNRIELIDEKYSNGYVTVSIRADIFPQDTTCRASDYTKSIAATEFQLRHRGQARVGSLYGLGGALSRRIQKEFEDISNHTEIKILKPFPLIAEQFLNDPEQLIEIGRDDAVQFILTSEIIDLSLQPDKKSKLAFWKGNKQSRNLTLHTSLFSTTTGELLFEKTSTLVAPWSFKARQAVDPNSSLFWQSDFGLATQQMLTEITQEIDQTVSCEPAYARVVNVSNGQLTIDVGQKQGVKQGDELQVFQLNQFFDVHNRPRYQYQIHPVKVRVTSLFNNSAVLESIDGAFLANIQPNDFVVRN
ncbi:hypothetical protein EYS14_07780 [Alteromonadaceae bacterium M269]|nr:hypothetical protein EYS14_07780 [Alteromonadaceae bacterium M269]